MVLPHGTIPPKAEVRQEDVPRPRPRGRMGNHSTAWRLGRAAHPHPSSPPEGWVGASPTAIAEEDGCYGHQPPAGGDANTRKRGMAVGVAADQPPERSEGKRKEIGWS